MCLKTSEVTRAYAIEMLNWKYPAPYEMYNGRQTESAIHEYLTCGYLAILNQDDQLIGSYCTGKSAQISSGHTSCAYEGDYLDIGLGMKPELTGKGFGKKFFAFILQQFKMKPLRLTVATFNQRAIRLYENFGFKRDTTFMSGETEFTTMLRDNI